MSMAWQLDSFFIRIAFVAELGNTVYHSLGTVFSCLSWIAFAFIEGKLLCLESKHESISICFFGKQTGICGRSVLAGVILIVGGWSFLNVGGYFV